MTPAPTRCSRDTAANKSTSNSTISRACRRSAAGHHVKANPGAGRKRGQGPKPRSWTRAVGAERRDLDGAEPSFILACVMAGFWSACAPECRAGCACAAPRPEPRNASGVADGVQAGSLWPCGPLRDVCTCARSRATTRRASPNFFWPETAPSRANSPVTRNQGVNDPAGPWDAKECARRGLHALVPVAGSLRVPCRGGTKRHPIWARRARANPRAYKALPQRVAGAECSDK